MDHGKRRKARIFPYLKVAVLAFLGFMILGSARPGVAGDVKVIKRIVGTVSGNLIYLDGKSVNLADVPIRNASGTNLSVSDITPGKKVGLWYRRGRLISVVVYGPMVE